MTIILIFCFIVSYSTPTYCENYDIIASSAADSYEGFFLPFYGRDSNIFTLWLSEVDIEGPK